MGEGYHNNHHAYPASARLSLRQGETDPGWWVLLLLKRLGLVWNVKTPETLPHRSTLVPLGMDSDWGTPRTNEAGMESKAAEA